MMERMRRLRVRSTQPDLRGSRETLPGPTMWVRPATGWWGRMNAGESPRNQGRTVWAPLSVSRRRSRDLRKTPQWSAARRAGPRHGPAVPSRWRDRLDRKVGPRGAAFRTSAFRRSAPSRLLRELSPREPRGWKCPALPAPCANRGGGALIFLRAGCLRCESDIAHESAQRILAERTRAR